MKTRRYRIGALLGGLILSLGSAGLQAQEGRPAPPPPRERPAPPANAPEAVRAERIRQRIRDLRAEGKHEEADRMIERVRQAQTDSAQRPAPDTTPRATADRRPDRQAQARQPERKGPLPQTEPTPAMKIRNLNMVARLLNASGYRDEAENARKEASRIEGEMRKAEELQKREGEMRKAEEAKRRDMEKRKVEEKKDRPDPAADMREEMKKLRREVEELRGQLKHAKAAAESRPERGHREENRPR